MAHYFEIADHLRTLGFVTSDMCGSRGGYFIDAYKPGAALAKKGWKGSFEIHIDTDSKKSQYGIQVSLRTPEGKLVKYEVKKSAKNTKQALFEDFKEKVGMGDVVLSKVRVYFDDNMYPGDSKQVPVKKVIVKGPTRKVYPLDKTFTKKEAEKFGWVKTATTVVVDGKEYLAYPEDLQYVGLMK